MSKWITGVLLGAGALLGGCRKRPNGFKGSFLFLNRSGIPVDWVETRGFQNVPPNFGPGVFPRDAVAAMEMNDVPYPDSCIVVWQYKRGEPSHQQMLPRKDIPPEQRIGKLVVEFTPQKIWIFRFHPDPNYWGK